MESFCPKIRSGRDKVQRILVVLVKCQDWLRVLWSSFVLELFESFTQAGQTSERSTLAAHDLKVHLPVFEHGEILFHRPRPLIGA